MRRLAPALRAGLGAWLAGALVAALLAAPLAAGSDFAHRHGDGTAPHVHAVTQLLAGETAPPPPAARAVAAPIVEPASTAEQALPPTAPGSRVPSRAPPAAIV